MNIEKRVVANKKIEGKMDRKDGKKVYQLAGLFQKAGNVEQGLASERMQAHTRLRFRKHFEHEHDARLRVENEYEENIQENILVDVETSREEDNDRGRADEPRRPNVLKMLDNEDNGKKKPARRIVEDIVDNEDDAYED